MEIAAYVVFALNSIALIILAASAINYAIHFKRGYYEQEKCIQQHNISRWLSLGTLFCYGVMIACIFFPNSATGTEEENLMVGMLWTLGIILEWTISMFGFNWKVEIYDDYFVHTNFIGVKHRYNYDEIEIRQYNACDRIFLNGKYRFTISYLQDNCDAIDVARAHYKHRLKQEAKRAEKEQSPTKTPTEN